MYNSSNCTIPIICLPPLISFISVSQVRQGSFPCGLRGTLPASSCQVHPSRHHHDQGKPEDKETELQCNREIRTIVIIIRLSLFRLGIKEQRRVCAKLLFVTHATISFFFAISSYISWNRLRAKRASWGSWSVPLRRMQTSVGRTSWGGKSGREREKTLRRDR